MKAWEQLNIVHGEITNNGLTSRKGKGSTSRREKCQLHDGYRAPPPASALGVCDVVSGPETSVLRDVSTSAGSGILLMRCRCRDEMACEMRSLKYHQDGVVETRSLRRRCRDDDVCDPDPSGSRVCVNVEMLGARGVLTSWRWNREVHKLHEAGILAGSYAYEPRVSTYGPRDWCTGCRWGCWGSWRRTAEDSDGEPGEAAEDPEGEPPRIWTAGCLAWNRCPSVYGIPVRGGSMDGGCPQRWNHDRHRDRGWVVGLMWDGCPGVNGIPAREGLVDGGCHRCWNHDHLRDRGFFAVHIFI